jgi:hypothetical protein
MVVDQHQSAEAAGFLPDDYVAMRRERRWNVLAASLFVLVISGVAIAFVATDRNWREVKATQREVHHQFDLASSRILEMESYEARVQSMLEKANTAIGLLDTAPKSILLASFMSCMPDGVSLRLIRYESSPIQPVRATVAAARSLGGENDPSPQPLEPRFWASHMVLEGVAESDQHVSAFMNALVDFPLLEHVRLAFSRQLDVDGAPVREFKITIDGDPKADVRTMRLAQHEETTP